MSGHTIIPAILPESFDDLREKVTSVHGSARRVQVDIADGTYAKKKTWPYNAKDVNHFDVLQKEDEGLPYWKECDYEIDFLLRNPVQHFNEWVRAGAMCFIVHAEVTSDVTDIIERCAAADIELAIATLPKSPLDLVAPWIPHVSFLQVMGNDIIGEQGRELQNEAVEKVATLHEQYPELTLGVDIGVNHRTLPLLIEAGASRFAVGSTLFTASEPRRVYNEIVRLCI